MTKQKNITNQSYNSQTITTPVLMLIASCSSGKQPVKNGVSQPTAIDGGSIDNPQFSVAADADIGAPGGTLKSKPSQQQVSAQHQ